MSPYTKHHNRLLHLPKPAAHWTRLLGLAVLVGITSGFAAVLLEYGLHHGAKHLVLRFVDFASTETFVFRWQVLVLPALGGLLSGIMVRLLCPKAIGHGTDVLVRAFHRNSGALPIRGPAVKAAAAIGVISCGGSAGPEGPIAALGAAIGSCMSSVFSLTPRERRTMLIAGCGAGIGAIFQCPMGGALFAVSILYRDPDFETDAVVPAFVASVVGYCIYMPFWGKHFPLLGSANEFAFKTPFELLPYAVLALVCGLVCIVFNRCLHFVEHRPLARLRMPSWLAPAIGGLATGLVACMLPQVMDGRYEFIQDAMNTSVFTERFSSLGAWGLVALFGGVVLAKCLATALTVGSGASGGVLGPSVFVGGAAGALVGCLFEALLPGMIPESLRQGLIAVGMAGVLSAAMRTPLAAIVMVAEMTGGYGLIVPSMLVCVGAYVIGRRFGLNSEQVQTAADSPAHAGDAIIHMLERWQVGDLMQRDWPETVTRATTLRELVTMINPGTHPVFAVVENSRIVGLISLPDIKRIMSEPGVSEAVIAADIMTDEVDTIDADENVYSAVTLMARENHVVMPVVSPREPDLFLGMLSRHEVYAAVRGQLDEMRRHLLVEHRGLAAIDQEENLQQLVMGVSGPKFDNIQRLLVPIQAVGRSLRESDFRQNYGVHVIAIEQPDGSLECPPNPDRPLQTNQRLVAIVQEAENGV